MKRTLYYWSLLTFVLLILSPTLYGQSKVAIWSTIQEKSISAKGKRYIIPQQYRIAKADFKALKQQLQMAPMERTKAAENQTVLLDIPMPDGSLHTFSIVEAPIMEPELAAKFPNIKSYSGKSVQDRSVTARLDISHKGFHALIFTLTGQIYVDPYTMEDKEHYISYYKKHFIKKLEKNQELARCLVGDPEFEHLVKKRSQQVNNQKVNSANNAKSSDGLFREYRIAVAATGEYTQFHGGTVADGLAGINTTMTRVNGIYEREVALRMNLIANNNLIIYTNGSTDPFTNNNPSALISESQTQINATIGAANYDIGHTVSTQGGGLAGLEVPCWDPQKASGITGLPNPIGDPYDVDYVSHELGHQWGGPHTFNGSTNGCSGNRSASSAYEPGSGTTIMAYAGLCSPQNTQNNSDDYFHAITLDQIIAYSTDTRPDYGGSCPTTTPIGNQAPVSNAGADYVIPLSTPFTLTGLATDADGDPLTYCWEQWDLGPAGHPNSPVGNAPLFRSFSPVTTPSRTFPQISDIINNTQTIGEILPSYARDMNFRLTVRDNGVTGLGGCISSDFMEVTVTSDGPFLVQSPNTATTWSDCVETVTWDVAGTDVAPINCANVNILLSTDGGLTYPTVLASNVPNTGSAMVTLPSVTTTTARVKVECANNIFFDISNTNFSINGSAASCPCYQMPSISATTICSGDAVTIDAQAVNCIATTSDITLTFTINGTAQTPINQACGNISESITLTHAGTNLCQAETQTISYIATCDANSTTVSSGNFTVTVYPDVSLQNNVVSDDGGCCPTISLECPATYEVTHNYNGGGSGNVDCSAETNSGSFDYTVSLIDATATADLGGTGNCVTVNYPVTFDCSAMVLELKLFLQGAYSTGSIMDVDLQAGVNVLPTVNPYGGTPWNHTVGESVTTQAAIPPNTVDWVLVELRDPVSFNWVEGVAGFLLNDGTVVTADGSVGLTFSAAPSNYHIVVRHRNHVDVMSTNPAALANGNNFYDFTDVNNVMNTADQVVLLFGSTYGLHSGDVNADGIINVEDYNEYLTQSTGTTIDVYTSGDCDLDGNINTNDFNNYQPNSSHIGVFWVRY